MKTDYPKEFSRLYDILQELRQKCPWDKKQTIHTLSQNTIEELYELIDSIHDEDWQGIKEELGDMMLHILFYSLMAEEKQQFTLYEVLHHICEKLIYRHPHIYSNTQADTEEEVMKNWEKLKLKEGKKSALEGVPLSLPAMVKATRMQEKVSRLGFDFPTISQAFNKIKEEEQELHEAILHQDIENIEEEMGDLFFSWINYARFLKINPETALEKTNKKFKRRFERMEKLATTRNLDTKNLNLEQWEVLYKIAWQEDKEGKLS